MIASPRFTYSGTELEREGQPPLLLVALYAPDGRLAGVSVCDPTMGPQMDTKQQVDGPAYTNRGAM